MCTGLIHGRMLVAAWEEGVESCEDQVRINCGTCASKKFNPGIIIFNISHISGCVPYHGGCTALPQVCSS